MKGKAASKALESAGLWAALVILGAVSALAYRSIDAAVDTFGWVEHAHQVIQHLEDVSSVYARAATARRAYIVAGDASQLDETPSLDARMERAVTELRDAVSDNADQSRRAREWGELLKRRIAILQTGVEQRRVEGSGAETAEGLAITARVRDVREEMERAENTLLDERAARTKRDVGRIKLAVLAGTCVSFALLLLAFRRLRHEVGQRRKSEEALRASEGFLDSIVENIPNMIFVKEAGELRFERFNRAGEDLLGVKRAELYGKNDFDLFPREQAEAFQARDRDTLNGRAILDIPEEPIQTGRGPRWLHTKKVPILDEQGAPRYLLGISEDITEDRAAAAALKVAKSAADAANQELEAFSYAVAHDLRAPLRAIDGFSQALEEDYSDKLDGDGTRHLARVRGASRQMAQLIDGLLGLSRLTRGEVTRAKVDLSHIAEQIVGRLREEHPERSVETVVQPGLSVEGDVRLLTATLENLIGNAWKFTGKRPQAARIEVGKETSDGEPAFFVRDNGAGFDQAYVHKLFTAFQRLHGATEFEGTGIGLATVQRIIRRHGGRIWAKGEVDRGATFYFTL